MSCQSGITGPNRRKASFPLWFTERTEQYQSPAADLCNAYAAGQSHVSEDLVNSAHPNATNLLYNLGGDIRYSSPSV
jgi:hypothetical protein